MMDELLSLIKENPRLTNAELAAALDRDEAQVAQQVRQYEADGVIKGYCAILDKGKSRGRNGDCTDRNQSAAQVRSRL